METTMNRTFIGMAFLLAVACGHPYQPDTAELVGKPGMPSTLNQTDKVVRATKLLREAEADSGYGQCIVTRANNTLYSGPQTDDINAVIEWMAVSAENECAAEFGRFMTSLRARAPAYDVDPDSSTDSEVKASIHSELVKSMQYSVGLSKEPSRLFPPPGTSQPI
jgi:hypothetical protein